MLYFYSAVFSPKEGNFAALLLPRKCIPGPAYSSNQSQNWILNSLVFPLQEIERDCRTRVRFAQLLIRNVCRITASCSFPVKGMNNCLARKVFGEKKSTRPNSQEYGRSAAVILWRRKSGSGVTGGGKCPTTTAMRMLRLFSWAPRVTRSFMPGPKRARHPRIGTHGGTFHCDEALACFLLKLLPPYQVGSPAAEALPKQSRQASAISPEQPFFSASRPPTCVGLQFLWCPVSILNLEESRYFAYILRLQSVISRHCGNCSPNIRAALCCLLLT